MDSADVVRWTLFGKVQAFVTLTTQDATEKIDWIVPQSSLELESLFFRYGRCYDSYLGLEAGREYFWSQDRSGVVAYVRRGKYLNISGGLIAPEEKKRQLLSEVLTFATEQQFVPSFYNIPEDELPLFRQFGFQITKWGEEALVDLNDQLWQGRAFEWVRRQVNYCHRQELVCSEWDLDELSVDERDAVVAELREVSAAPLALKPQAAEMTFLEGSFDPSQMDRKRLFIAQADGGTGRIEGFLVANPCLNGAAWAFELYRYRPDAVRGTVAFLMHQTIQRLQFENVTHISLCLVPGLRCETPLPGDSGLVRHALVIAQKYFDFLFNTAGTHYFKSRFRPRYENRYLCVWPKATVGSFWAFVRVIGVLNLSPVKLWQSLRQQIRSSKPLAISGGTRSGQTLETTSSEKTTCH